MTIKMDNEEASMCVCTSEKNFNLNWPTSYSVDVSLNFIGAIEEEREKEKSKRDERRVRN